MKSESEIKNLQGRGMPELSPLILNAVRTCTMVYNAAGRVVFVNAAARELLNLPREMTADFDGRESYWRLLRKDGTPAPPEEYPTVEVINTGQPVHDRLSLLHRSIPDDSVWVLLSAVPICDQAGALGLVVITLVEVTAFKRAEDERTAELSAAEENCRQLMENRKQLEQTLEKSERTRQALLDSTYESIMLLDLEGKLLAVNKVVAERLGRRQEELLGHKLWDFMPREVAEHRQKNLAAVVRTKKPLRDVDERDGRFYDSNLCPVLDESGGVVLLAIFTRDITEERKAEEALRQSEETLVKAQDIARLGSWEWDISTDKVTWSRAIYRILEVNPQDLGDTFEVFLSLVHPDDRDRVRAVMAEAVFEEKSLDLEFWLLGSDGGRTAVHALAEVVSDELGEPIKVVGTIQDITLQKNAERELRVKESAIQSSINAVILTDLEGRITYVNHACLEMWGYAEEKEILGRTPLEFLHDPAAAGKAFETVMSNKEWFGELAAKKKDGSPFDIQVSASTVADEKGQPICLMYSTVDITEKKKAEELLLYQAHFDLLTGLLNRRRFMVRLETEIKTAKRHAFPVSLCMCDLDHFKSVNDTYGHAVGDEVLAGFGRLINSEIRAGDAAGRYGGEEFTVIMPHTTAASAVPLLERIRRKLAETVFGGDHRPEFTITASFGVTDLTSEKQTEKELLEEADEALYKAKESGRNRVVLHEKAGGLT